MKFKFDIHELQMKNKKKSVLNGSFLSSFVEGGNNLFNLFKGGNLTKKVWGTPKVIY